MLELAWLDHVAGGTLESGMEYVNSVGWNLAYWEHNGQWYITAGETLLLSTDSREAVDAFLYGMALSYSVIPENILNLFREEIS